MTSPSLNGLKLLCFVGDDYEDLELWYPKLRMAEAGVSMTLAGLEAGRLSGWDADVADSAVFFATIRMHTILGFVLDPRHGGNRDYVGWQVMGYPGPPHQLGGAQADQMIGKVPFEPIWKRRSPQHGH